MTDKRPLLQRLRDRINLGGSLEGDDLVEVYEALAAADAWRPTHRHKRADDMPVRLVIDNACLAVELGANVRARNPAVVFQFAPEDTRVCSKAWFSKNFTPLPAPEGEGS